MVEIGHPLLTAGGAGAASGLDVLRLSDLHRLIDRAVLGRPLRVPCHLLMLFSAGRGRHHIDFVDHGCRPSTLLWGRPGQVHGFSTQPGLDATVLLFTPDLLPPRGQALDPLTRLLDDPFAPSSWLPTGEDEEAIITEVTQLATDRARHTAGDGVPPELLRHQLAVLLMRTAALRRPKRPGVRLRGAAELLARFHRELTGSFSATRRVEDYAA